jgi:hypothetical protein
MLIPVAMPITVNTTATLSSLPLRILENIMVISSSVIFGVMDGVELRLPTFRSFSTYTIFSEF